jgi:hypothetical protein
MDENLRTRCQNFKDDHDMGYSVDDLIAFVAAEIERARVPNRNRAPGYTQYTNYRP